MAASSDRSVRNLGALQKTASTSRVLNLLAVGAEHRSDPEYLTQPFFRNAILNESLILKHRLRADERFVFNDQRHVATKVIIPFERTDLRMGGRSFFVGQKGWISMVQELAGEDEKIHHDVAVLEALDEIPSLDPFLLREHLSRRGFPISAVYFAISDADMERMQSFVGSQICELIDMAFPKGSNTGSERMATVLLSNKIDERLEPLRMVMRLDAETYREGIFCWKGFLYYKWALADMAPKLAVVLKELPMLRPAGHRDRELMVFIEESRGRLMKAINQRRKEVAEALQVYDDAYKDLTQNGKPMAFRDFLLKAPTMFMILGERIGSISHISSFWRFRFRDQRDLAAPIEEVVDILADFEANLASFDNIAA
ncbi:MAG: hypothetical protein CGW95_16460 [Phenylobacterium zucineum]|nr:MAG: hypothetical protein CGW95_16460 [Phenylobacterium zucineum]